MKARALFAWIAAAAAAVLALAWAYPRANPLYPDDWSVSNGEAREIALEQVRDLGDLPEDPYLIATIGGDFLRRYRLEESVEAGLPPAEAQASHAFSGAVGWRVTIYDRESPSYMWRYRVFLTPDGELVQLQRQLSADEGEGVADAADARRRADAFLRSQGIDLERFEPPTSRTRDLETRTDTMLRYRERERLFGDEVDYGLEVVFAGDELTGFAAYTEDPSSDRIEASTQSVTLLANAWFFSPLILMLLIAPPFLKRYHAGEVGVAKGLQIGGLVLACGVVVMLFAARGNGEGWNIGTLTRPQVINMVAFQTVVIRYMPLALMAFLSWSTGESLCRERWGSKLAALDAMLKGQWRNATFARAALRGTVGGLALAAAMMLVAVPLRSLGFSIFELHWIGRSWDSARWFSIPLVAEALATSLTVTLFGALLLVSGLRRRLGVAGAALVAAAVVVLVSMPPILGRPMAGSFVLSALLAIGTIALFLRYGLLTAVMARLGAGVLLSVFPLLTAPDSAIQLHASLSLLIVGLPLIAGARYLLSDEEFVYRYDEVPPHVRRIADRERQKVELETARRIQSSILPELPPEVNGIRLAHEYLPATEVGGDFYDVLALEDGRLAVAVGDVAGHGVSSGLVMSMAKSALAVQVTFNPDVEAVFGTLNRMIYQSARKRLLTTLCYALLDPQRRELTYASAGHLFPYRIKRSGEVLALESVSYPLGVRDRLEIRVRSERLDAGDTLFLFSDGVVESRPEGSDEQFGFERLESSLKRHAGEGAVGLKDGVLRDLKSFIGNIPLEDDLTVLVVQLPS